MAQVSSPEEPTPALDGVHPTTKTKRTRGLAAAADGFLGTWAAKASMCFQFERKTQEQQRQ